MVKANKWLIFPCSDKITIMNVSLCALSNFGTGWSDFSHIRTKLSGMKNLCCSEILGHDFLCWHSRIRIAFGGLEPTIKIWGLAAVSVQYPSLFNNLMPECKPIAVKSRLYSHGDKLLKLE